MPRKKVFIIGLDDFNKAMLERLPQARECEFLPALTYEEIRGVSHFDIHELIDRASSRMTDADGGPDAVVSFYDFPGTIMVPILAEKFGLPGPSLKSVMKCENKYWSRLEQQKVVPRNIPEFRAFSPEGEDVFESLKLIPPFWIKPIKSFRSFLAFQINDAAYFEEVLPVCREKGEAIGKPFRQVMEMREELPHEIVQMPQSFIAESAVHGWQCTLEGYAYDGRVAVYAVIDSVRAAKYPSLARYQYPSILPDDIRHRMIDITRTVMHQIGYNNAPFNIEFFYDQTADRLWLLEINPRISQSHANILEKVHGVSHHSVLLDLAFGRRPDPLEGQGEFDIAAKFMLRTTESGRAIRVPDESAISKLRERQPATEAHILVKAGQHLSELKHQDMYSYELANVFIGGQDRADLLRKFEEARSILRFEIEKDPETVVV